MLQSKENSIKTLLSSHGGIHFTTYLKNNGSAIALRKQISESLSIAQEHLSSVMPADELRRFLFPVTKLLNDSTLLKRFKNNIGVFRTNDSFRMINVPVDIDHLCVVATSFHIKPLLYWLRNDQEFLLLGLERDSASLYIGSQNNLNFIDTIIFPQLLQINNLGESYSDLKLKKKQALKLEETMEWLNEWVFEVTDKKKPTLFLAGDIVLTQKLLSKIRYPQIRKKPIANTFSQNLVLDTVATVRSALRKEVKENFKKSILEFYWAEDMKQGKTNIFQIAKAVVQGNVKKLIVADDIQIFGKMCKTTGGISIHPCHLDHEDDDLLDDLAQTVLEFGGEVIVVKRDDIPKRRPILAILKNNQKHNLSLEAPQFYKEQHRQFA